MGEAYDKRRPSNISDTKRIGDSRPLRIKEFNTPGEIEHNASDVFGFI